MNAIEQISEMINDEVEDGYTIAYLRRAQEFIRQENAGNLTCDICGDKKTAPYAPGDSCICGGIYQPDLLTRIIEAATDDKIQEVREIFLDSGSSKNYQNKQFRSWLSRLTGREG